MSVNQIFIYQPTIRKNLLVLKTSWLHLGPIHFSGKKIWALGVAKKVYGPAGSQCKQSVLKAILLVLTGLLF